MFKYFVIVVNVGYFDNEIDIVGFEVFVGVEKIEIKL